MSEVSQRIVRAPGAIVWLVATATVVGLLLVDVVIRVGWFDLFLLAPWLLLPVWFMWVFFYVPHITASSEGARVHNPIRTVWVPWDAVDDIVLRWQVEFRLADGQRVQSWGAPSKKQTSRSREQPAEREVEILLGLRDAHRAMHPVAPHGRVVRSWNVPALIAFAGIALWAIGAQVVAATS